ncbi:MAG: hypothetical protein A2018_00310 [Alphaproteobacteria bacterium GWF2_58_20]|nr:MAG: hypothetical protein A2018_00310 [Alphaproteobacteria bacterium GWF2_58_20]
MKKTFRMQIFGSFGIPTDDRRALLRTRVKRLLGEIATTSPEGYALVHGMPEKPVSGATCEERALLDIEFDEEARQRSGGLACYSSNTITLPEASSDAVLYVALVHELVHADQMRRGVPRDYTLSPRQAGGLNKVQEAEAYARTAHICWQHKCKQGDEGLPVWDAFGEICPFDRHALVEVMRCDPTAEATGAVRMQVFQMALQFANDLMMDTEARNFSWHRDHAEQLKTLDMAFDMAGAIGRMGIFENVTPDVRRAGMNAALAATHQVYANNSALYMEACRACKVAPAPDTEWVELPLMTPKPAPLPGGLSGAFRLASEGFREMTQRAFGRKPKGMGR